jgi:hypothetical protein
MSGSPKYSRAELDRQRQAKLESDRRRKAEQEAHRRQEAEERERQRQLEAGRKRVTTQLETLLTQINQQSDLIYAGDRQGLEQKGQSLQQQIQAAILPDKLSNLTTEIQQLQRVWEEAKHQKWHAEQEKLRQQELDRQKLALEDCDRRLAERLADAQKFDGSGLRFVQQSLAQVKDLITQGHPDTMRPSLKDCQLAIAAYLDKVQALKQTWLAEKAQAEQELAQLQTAIAGLQADPVVMLWQEAEVWALIKVQQQAEKAIEQEQFAQTAVFLTQVQASQTQIIATANVAQLKADQRDYIADSIAESLQEMGFSIVYRQPEQADHPASAIILGAATNSGKGISVSVPVEGEVFYDVEGYSKQTVAAVGVGSAPVCDEAEKVITEMHEVLAAQFGVQMGALDWEGKDPHRQLRQADSLPQTQGHSVRRS